MSQIYRLFLLLAIPCLLLLAGAGTAFANLIARLIVHLLDPVMDEEDQGRLRASLTEESADIDEHRNFLLSSEAFDFYDDNDQEGINSFVRQHLEKSFRNDENAI